MIYNYYKVNENGEITDRYKLEESDSHIEFRNLIKEWDGELDNPIYDFQKKSWVEDKTEEDILEDAKMVKNDKLSRECQDIILNGFTYDIFDSTYHFSYDKEAQTNILDVMRLFENNMIEEITWNGRLHNSNGSRVRLKLNKEQFYGLYTQSVKHKLGCVSKYRDDLTDMLEKANTVEEVENISWDSVGISTFEARLNKDETIEDRLGSLANKTVQLEGETTAVSLSLLELSSLMLSL